MAETAKQKKARLLKLMGGPSAVNPDLKDAMAGKGGERPDKPRLVNPVLPLTDAERMDMGLPLLQGKGPVKKKKKIVNR